MEDYVSKQQLEPIPMTYYASVGEFGGGIASIATERYHGGKWRYCPGPAHCKAKQRKSRNS